MLVSFMYLVLVSLLNNSVKGLRSRKIANCIGNDQ